MSASITAPAVPAPNFLIVMADDCTFRDMEVYGGPARTPHIKQLASEGMTFDRCFQATAMCAPTRMNLMTGVYPVRNGGYRNHSQAYPDMKSIVHHLKAAGYRVGLTGKRHIEPESVFPFEYSKDDSVDFDFASRFIGSSMEEKSPFCIFVTSHDPHVPWTQGDPANYPPAELKLPPYLIDTPETRVAYSRYLAEIEFFDKEVGTALGLLDKHGVREETLVIVLGEHGNLFPFEKWTCYDAGLQSAMVVRFPGSVKAGTRTDAMVEYVDIVPTLLDFAKADPVSELDGRSFLPVLTSAFDTHKTHVFGIQTTLGVNSAPAPYGIRSVRDANYKLIVNLFPENRFGNALTMDPEKWTPAREDYLGWMRSWREAAKSSEAAKAILKRYVKRPPLELYNLNEDPYEMNNLAEDPDQQPRVEELKGVLEKWMADQGDLGRQTELKRLPMEQRGSGKTGVD